MPRRGLRDLGGHPPPRNFQPHQPLNHCPHLQPPHQSQLEPSREPRRGPRDDFSVLGWVLCGHRFAVSRARFVLEVKRVNSWGGIIRGFLQFGLVYERVHASSLYIRQLSMRKCVSYLPTSSCGSLVHSFRRTATTVAASEALRSTETVRLAGSPASFSIFTTAAATFSFLRIHSPCHGFLASHGYCLRCTRHTRCTFKCTCFWWSTSRDSW